jgi:Tfp pilus assembly protein PilN
MASNNLIIDFSEEYIAIHCKGISYVTEVTVASFFENTTVAIEALFSEIKEKRFGVTNLVITLPLVCINHQIVTLPENVDDKEKLIFLGLEINKKLFGKRFGVQKLEVTQRDDNGQPLCDYLIMAPKQEVYTKLEELAKLMQVSIAKVVPSIYLLGAERVNELRATAWIGQDRSELVIWGKDNPLSMAYFQNSGDQIGDINRYIVDYFDHVDGLSLSLVYLFGPKMRDSALGFGLTYPHQIFEDPTKFIVNNLHRAASQLNIAAETKLPKPPIAMTPRNIAFLVSAVAVVCLMIFTFFNHAKNFRLERQLATLDKQATKYKKLVAEYKRYEKNKLELENEQDFYLEITRRRTPWQKILADISKLTPSELWFERLNATKNKLFVAGKARTTKDVSAFSINLNENSQYVKDALIIGVRDYEESSQTFREFQITAKLKSPTGQVTDRVGI